MTSPIYFAIGDIHGESGKLAELHDAILERIAFEKQPARIIHLGDYVDRGHDSRGAIELVMALEERFRGDAAIEVISLAGNHEQMMLDYLAGEGGSWIDQGGRETVESYGASPEDIEWRRSIPQAHLKWMTGLQVMVHDVDRKLVFVHAGIEPSTFPNCRTQVRLWTRAEAFMNDALWPRDRPELEGLRVIHGHTPKSYQPEITKRRINVDTGAVFGGPLTAVMLKDDAEPQFLRAN
jgi:serine/threonine protein phosphatase 1